MQAMTIDVEDLEQDASPEDMMLSYVSADKGKVNAAGSPSPWNRCQGAPCAEAVQSRAATDAAAAHACVGLRHATPANHPSNQPTYVLTAFVLAGPHGPRAGDTVVPLPVGRVSHDARYPAHQPQARGPLCIGRRARVQLLPDAQADAGVPPPVRHPAPAPGAPAQPHARQPGEPRGQPADAH
eukprot:72984-Chlamydomonas_euryale.AAC.3